MENNEEITEEIKVGDEVTEKELEKQMWRNTQETFGECVVWERNGVYLWVKKCANNKYTYKVERFL